MKNLFDPVVAAELTARLGRLSGDSSRLWGKMTAPQALAHCSSGFEWALGDTRPPRMFLGRILGGFVKRMALGSDDPFRRNSPTAPSLIVTDMRELAPERTRLLQLIDRFTNAGPTGCTINPHSFFGRLTPEEWSVLMYKHVDHHLRQFGA